MRKKKEILLIENKIKDLRKKANKIVAQMLLNISNENFSDLVSERSSILYDIYICKRKLEFLMKQKSKYGNKLTSPMPKQVLL